MKRIRKKLNSRKGASITYALLIFLVCAVVGSAVLVAGTVSSGRMSQVAEYDQRYYAVTSAARLMIKLIDDQTVTILKEEISDGSTPDPDSKKYYRSGSEISTATNFDSIPAQTAFQIISGGTLGNTFSLTTTASELNVGITEAVNSSNGQMIIGITKTSGTPARTYGLELYFNLDKSEVVDATTDESGVTTTITTCTYTWHLRDIKVS